MIPTERIKMYNTEPTKITITAEDEKSLYSPFSPEPTFSDGLKKYIKERVSGEAIKKSVSLHVIAQVPLDEDRFRIASSNWIKREREKFREEEKETLGLLAGLLIFGSIFIILSLALEKRIGVVEHTLIPIIGSLALSRAAGIMIIELPTLRAKRWILDGLEKNNVITFEYCNDKEKQAK